MSCSLRRYVARLVPRSPKAATISIDDVLAVQLLQPLMPEYFPFSSAALRPNALLRLVNDIYANCRRTAIEFGAGASTLILGHALRNVGGSLLSVEHDADWAVVVKDAIERGGLGKTVRVVVAPLMPQSFDRGESVWYSRAVVEEAMAGSRFDLVVVDGPPAYEPGTEYRRYPALPVVLSHLTETFTVALDDATRNGEKKIAAEWASLTGLNFDISDTANMAFARSGKAFHC